MPSLVLVAPVVFEQLTETNIKKKKSLLYSITCQHCPATAPISNVRIEHAGSASLAGSRIWHLSEQ